MKLVIVGHVDHGKSTLIGRILCETRAIPGGFPGRALSLPGANDERTEFAHLMDHLEEERVEGMTIDTTQAFFKTGGREYVIIDAPGHAEFVKNMITGASQAQAAILVIDAAEGMLEETRRHLTVLSLLGLRQILVAVNKMDLVDFNQNRFEEIKRGCRLFLDSMGIRPKYFIPISAKLGDQIVKRSPNLKWYAGPTLLKSLVFLKDSPLAERGDLFFPLQDLYSIAGKKIAVGRVESGRIKIGQRVRILPGGKITRVASIEKYPEKRSEARAGESIGVTTEDPLPLKRGDLLCDARKKLPLTDQFKAKIFWFGEKGCSRGEGIFLKLATQEVPCKMESILQKWDSSTLKTFPKRAKAIKNLEVGEILLKLQRPIVIRNFNEVPELGRFVLVRENRLSAGGIVTGI